MRNIKWPWTQATHPVEQADGADASEERGALHAAVDENHETAEASAASVAAIERRMYGRLGVPQQLNYPSTTLGRLLDQTADRFPDQVAVVYYDRHWTYRDLLAYANRVAGGLAELGVRKGDRVVMTLPNCPEYVGAFFAVQKLGAVLVNAGPLVGRDDLAKLIEWTRPRLLIGLDLQAVMLTSAAMDAPELRWLWVSLRQYQPAWKRVGYRLKLWQAHHRPTEAHLHMSFDAMLERAPARPPTVAPQPDDVAVLQLTSGTTGRLKVAMLTHRSLLANATQVAISARMHPGQGRVIGLLPMFHVYGLTMCLTSVVYSAATVAPFTRFSATEMLNAIVRHQPTVMCVVPAMADALCDLLQRRDPTPVRAALRQCIVISGSAPLPPATARRFYELTGARILEGYGLTEASPVTHCNPPDDPRDNSIGVPLPDTQVRIVDLEDRTREVETGQTGELLISGPQVFAGYYDDEQSTDEMFSVGPDGGRWLHTGDVGHCDEDGFFYLVDRCKNMINHSGFKVWPAKVEQVLKSHADVQDVAVVGREDPVHTERVVALIVPRDGDALDIAELRSLCREHLARYEVPVEFELVEKLPRSALGKLLRHRIGEEARPLGAARDGDGARQAHADGDGAAHDADTDETEKRE